MKQPLVSVIMPVWNVEKFIERAVTSILNQTYANIELVVIDDNTPDDSMLKVNQLCTLFPTKEVCIYSHDKNRGLGAARLTGLMKAKGEYVLFVDSDDYVESDYVNKMIDVALAAESDIVISDYFISYINSETYCSQLFKGSGIELALAIMEGRLQGFLWNKLIRRNIFFDNNVFPIEGINMWEDVCLICRLAYFAKRISYLPQAFYHYNQMNMSSYSTCKIAYNSVDNLFKAVTLIEEFYKVNEHAIITQNTIESFKLMAKAFCLMRSSKEVRKRLFYCCPELKWHFIYRKLTPYYVHLILLFNVCRVDFMIDWVNHFLYMGRKVKLFVVGRI